MIGDLTPVFWFAAVGLFVVLLLVIPAGCAAVAALVWHVFTSEWSWTPAYWGGGLGFVPAVLVLWHWR